MTETMIRPLVAAALLAMAAPAFADLPASSATLAINTTDIDLSTAKGRKALERRVDSAINRFCGTAVTGSRDEAEELDRCRSEARAKVQPQMQAMMLRASVTMSGNE